MFFDLKCTTLALVLPSTYIRRPTYTVDTGHMAIKYVAKSVLRPILLPYVLSHLLTC